jgi:hypothetical protein
MGDEGPRASTFNGEPKAVRKSTRRAAALHGAAGAVLVLVSPEGAPHLGCTHSMAWLGQVLERALNDWRASEREAAAGAPVTGPTVVEARHIPKLVALRALAGDGGDK